MLKFKESHQCPQCADFVTVGVNVAFEPLQNIIGVADIATVGFAAVTTLHELEIALTHPEALLVTCKVNTVAVEMVKELAFEPLRLPNI
jgi:hypothetical protein